MISVEDWAEIRRLHRAEQMPIRAIARQLGISKNTVKRALATDRPPVYSRPAKGSAVDAVEPQIRELLKQTPTMPATVIAERIGWERGMTVLKERVRELRPAYLPVDPVSRTTYQPGELAQCDLWFPPADIPLGLRAVRPSAGARDGLGLLADHCRADAAHPHHRRPDRRALEAADRLECGSADARLGQRGRYRPRQGDRRLRCVRGPACHPDLPLQTP
ncbi:helix-turn-helix domain-containing protein [Streptomyces sp. RLB3-6]|uniref:helix-turn-helix domain-containing protein n=1 Tax=Streptomyces sp. RLB3-6 TaxID=2594457 RepID=UPI001F072B7E|nr:helix-turn-helix domain-containing protein [Streptomyces sp. RLB3-6]